MFHETAQSVAAQIAKGGGAIVDARGERVGSGRWVEVPGTGGQGRWMEVKRIGVLPAFTGQGLGAVILGALEAQGREAGMAGAQLAVRFDQPGLVDYYAALGYQLAEDVTLTTINPRAPLPVGMRKWF